MPSPRDYYDWSFYSSSGIDPVPWDPEEVQEIVDHYDKIVGRLERALESLSKTEDYGAGEAMDALSVKMEDLPKKLEEAKETYEAAVSAYEPYITALTTARELTRSLAVRAKAAGATADNEDLGKEAREKAEDRLDEFQAEAQEAYAALVAAADTAKSALDAASRGLGEQLLDAWDGFVDYLRDNPIIYFIAAVVVGIALLFVPGIGWAILAGMIVGAIFLAIDLTMLHKEGKLGNNWETWATIGMGIVGMVPGVSALRALGKTNRLGNAMSRAGNAVPGSVRNGIQSAASAVRSAPGANTVSNVLTRTSNFTQAAGRGTLNGSAGQSLAVDMAINVTRDSATGAAGNLVVEKAKGMDGGDTNYWQAAAMGAATGAPAAFVGTGVDHNMFGSGPLVGGENASSPLGINDHTPPSSDTSATGGDTSTVSNDGSPATTTETAPDGSVSSTTTIGDGSGNATVHQEFSSSGTATSTTIETPPTVPDSAPATTTPGSDTAGAGATAPDTGSNNNGPTDHGNPTNTSGSTDTTPETSSSNGPTENSSPASTSGPAETTITPSESGNPEVSSSGDFGTFTVQDNNGGHGEGSGTNSDSGGSGTSGDKGETSVRYESPDNSRTTAEFSEPGRADITVAPNETVNVSGHGDQNLQVEGSPSRGGTGTDVTLSRPHRQDESNSIDAPDGRRDNPDSRRDEGISHSRDDNEVNVSTENGNARVRKDDEGTTVTTPEGATVSRTNDPVSTNTVRAGNDDLTLTFTPKRDPDDSSGSNDGPSPEPITTATVHAEGGGSVVTSNGRQADVRADGYDVSGGFGWHRVSHNDGTTLDAVNSHGSVNTQTTGGSDSQVGITSPDGSISLARDVDGNTVVAPQGLPPVQLDGAGVPVAPVPWLGPTPQRTPSGTISNGTVTARPDGSITHPKFDLRPNGQGITIREDGQTWRFDGQGRPDPANPPEPPPGALTQTNDTFTYKFEHEGQHFQVSPPRDLTNSNGDVVHVPQRFIAPDHSIEFSPNGSGGNDIRVTHGEPGSDRLIFDHQEHGGTNVSTSSGYSVSGDPGQNATAQLPHADLSTTTDGNSSTTSNGDLVTVQDASGSASTSPRWAPEQTLVQHDGGTTTAFGDNHTDLTLGPDGTRLDTRLTEFTLGSGQGRNTDVKSDFRETTVTGPDNAWQVGSAQDGIVGGQLGDQGGGMRLIAEPDGRTHFSDGDQVVGVGNPDGSTDLTVTKPDPAPGDPRHGERGVTVDSTDGTTITVDSGGATVASADGNYHEVDFPNGTGPKVTVNEGHPNQPVISADRTVNLTNSRGQEVTVTSQATQRQDHTAPDSTDRRTRTTTTEDSSGTARTSTTDHNPKDSKEVGGPSMSRNPENGQTVVEHRGFHAERTGTDDAELTVKPLGEDGPTVVRDTEGNTATRTETVEVNVSQRPDKDAHREVTISQPGSPGSPTLSWSRTPPDLDNTVTLGPKGAQVEISWNQKYVDAPTIKGDTSGHTITRTTVTEGFTNIHLRNDATGEVTTIEWNGNVRHDNGTDLVNIAPNGGTTTTPKSDTGTGTIRQTPLGEVEMRFKPAEGSDTPRVLSHIDKLGQVEARLSTPRDGDRPAESWGTGIDRNGQATVDNLRSWGEGPIRLRPDGEVHNVDSAREIRMTGQGLREQDSLWGHESRSEQFTKVYEAVFTGFAKEGLNQLSGAIVDQMVFETEDTWRESLEKALLNSASTGISREISDLKYQGTTLGAQNGLERVGWQTFADTTKATRQQLEDARLGGMQDPLGTDEKEPDPEFTETPMEDEEEKQKETQNG